MSEFRWVPLPAVRACTTFAVMILLLLGAAATGQIDVTRAANQGLAAPAPRLTGDLERVVLERAAFHAEDVVQSVDLPHVVPFPLIPDAGGLVSYHLVLDIQDVPSTPLGVYLAKMSLAGRFYLNGQLIASCGTGSLELLRCLHQPQFFVPPPSIWIKGVNHLVFEIYANNRQMNGLSPVFVGDADSLYRGLFSFRYGLQVELLRGLTWVVLSIGLIALGVASILRKEWMYWWFGLCAIFNSLSNLNVLITYPFVNEELYSWFVFSSRLVTAPLFVLLVLEFFGRCGKWWRSLFLGYALIMPFVTWFSGNDRLVVFFLYQPVSIAAVVVGFFALRWVWQKPTPANIGVVFCTWALIVISAGDMFRLGGSARFDGFYLITYILSVLFFVFGVILIARLASALRAERRLGTRNRLATEAAQAAFWDWDASSDRLTWSSGSEALTTRKPQSVEVERPTWSAWCHPDDRPRLLEALNRALTSDEPIVLEHRLVTLDKCPRWVVSHALVDGEPGKAGGRVLTGISIDISARKRAELDLKRLVDERQRLMQDMHDGFGTELSTARIRIKYGELTQSQLLGIIDECIDDLRLVVDTLDNADNDLEIAIATYRHRLSARLGDAPFTLKWDVRFPKALRPGARSVLQMMRLLQEALNNAIKHSGAGVIKITVNGTDDDRLVIAVADDGHGFNRSVDTGRGLLNMERRVEALGGAVTIQSSPSGTLVEFVFLWK
jgi:signal transduction histidine kinase